jgi:hypothetical protein
VRMANKRADKEPEDSSAVPAASTTDPAPQSTGQPADGPTAAPQVNGAAPATASAGPSGSAEPTDGPAERRSVTAAPTPAAAPAPTPAATPAGTDPGTQRRRGRSAGEKVKAGSRAVRSKIASLVWLVAVVCALFLAVGALLVALNANQDNSIVQFVLDGADVLDGPFSRDNGPFTFDGKDAQTKSALVNWGLAAVVYLVIGKIADRIIRP